MKQAYYHSSIEDFLKKNDDEIVGILNIAGTAYASQWADVTISWDSSIKIFKDCCNKLIQLNTQAKNWHILLEYEIPRLASRIDAVILAEDLIFVIEYKYDRKAFNAADIRQVEDYANDLHDFHLQSNKRKIIPVLLAPLADERLQDIQKKEVFILPCLKVNSKNFPQIVYDSFLNYHSDNDSKINPITWEQSEYQPTPTIIQAAKALFAGQKVENITKSGAEHNDLKKTTDYLIKVINEARTKGKKIVCFVTGVPGAGKTLIGLNIVHEKNEFGGVDDNTAYFSGNVPLINVLRQALSKDHYGRQKKLHEFKKIAKPKKEDSKNQIKTKIQNLHLFIKDGIRKATPPTERIVIFDEAQRCWNAHQFATKAKQNQNREKNPFKIEDKSEAELLFEFMNRHDGWAVIIALVGGGQEINSGEGGIGEWGKAIQKEYSNWEVYISEQLLSGDSSTAGQTLFASIPENIIIHRNDSLHLRISQRSFKANNLNTWVNALISNKPDEAYKLAEVIKKNYPLYITRNIETAKTWLIEKKSGNKRIGLIASSEGVRLKPYGIYVKEIIDEALWFLNEEDDIRSSYYLELVATEYKVQGLELDWAGICWDADLRRNNNAWDFKIFSGKKWNNSSVIEQQQFLLNTYRVLLTRAREGIIIFVPQGDVEDKTRLPEFYDPIFNYLVSCGLQVI